MTSTDIINDAKLKYENLVSYGFDWVSFYNGYVEGRIAGIQFKQATESHSKDIDKFQTDIIDKFQDNIIELNQRLIDRQETLMTAMVALKQATQLLTRCSNASKQMSQVLQDDIRDFLKSQPSYRC